MLFFKYIILFCLLLHVNLVEKNKPLCLCRKVLLKYVFKSFYLCTAPLFSVISKTQIRGKMLSLATLNIRCSCYFFCGKGRSDYLAPCPLESWKPPAVWTFVMSLETCHVPGEVVPVTDSSCCKRLISYIYKKTLEANVKIVFWGEGTTRAL